MEKSKGQALVERLSAWLAGYMAFTDSRIALVLALWAIHTWVSERFDATPYLSITAATKQAGKTRLLSLLSMVSRQGKMFADVTPAYLYTWLEENDGRVTIFADEAEKLSSSALGVLRSMMNTGYLAGQTVGRKMGARTVDYPVYCPKAFAAIGDVNDTLRDRSIVITLERGKPTRDMRRVVAMGEAAAIVEDIRHVFVDGWPGPVEVDWLTGRDREIWAAIFGVAVALKLDRETMRDLRAVSADLVAAKSAPRRRYERQDAEDGAIAASYGERAVMDLRSVLRDGEPMIFSVVAVQRMKALEVGPWRAFKGEGLTEMSLASLVSPFDLGPKLGRMAKGSKARVARGYPARAVKAAAARLEGGV